MASRLLGQLLRGIRAGDKKMIWNHPVVNRAPESITLTSSSFSSGGAIPMRCAGVGVGDNLSPSLEWRNVPFETAELVLVMEDPDAPLPTPVVHLIATHISPLLHGINEGELSHPSLELELGRNTLRKLGYAGPRPMPGHGVHNYIFQIHAIKRALNFIGAPTRRDLIEAMRDNVIARGRLVGTYERK